MKKEKPKVVVYTAIAGTYDHLSSHSYISPYFDYVCFTDFPIKDPNIKWQVQPMIEFEHKDPVRKAKYYKLFPHLLFPEYDYSIWIDGNWDIKGPDLEQKILNLIHHDSQVATLPHPERNCIYKEAEVCLKYGNDNPLIIKKWIQHIRKMGYPNNNGLYEMCIIYRKHHDIKIIELMERWWHYISEFSRRDQLSYCVALNETSVHHKLLFPESRLSPRFGHPDYGFINHKKNHQVHWPWRKISLPKFDNLLSIIHSQHSLTQQLKNRFISDEKAIKTLYAKHFSNTLNLSSPTSFNEKLQWLKLHGPLEQMQTFSDKVSVRREIKKLGLGHLLNPMIGTFGSSSKINLKDLPEKFALKANHGSGYNVLCLSNSNQEFICEQTRTNSWKHCKKMLHKWMNRNYYWHYREANYKHIKPLILAEHFIEDPNNNLLDYKVFCFNGQPKFIQVDSNRFSEHSRNVYDTQWNRLPFGIRISQHEKNDVKPERLDEMMHYAKILSKPFPFVRVDFFYLDNKIIFGEMTFFPNAGVVKYYSDKDDYDAITGEWLSLETTELRG